MLFGPRKNIVLDYDTLSDSRIADFFELGLVTGRLLLPEPPPPSDSDHRARRAWETVGRLRKVKGLAVKLDRSLLEGDGLAAAVRRHKATLLTASAELAAACDGGPAVTTLAIYRLFKPAYLPGTELRVRIAKKGKDKNEGIAYLEGGVKVVVDDAADAVGSELDVTIQGALSTDVGRVVFARRKFTEVR
ncbi:TRAM domain-containing protein [candidate division WOR-3 bacterium]|nr:TRAM domain-containing protein [candidate division WOR-3 bacterium]